jgi:hypothetical protein
MFYGHMTIKWFISEWTFQLYRLEIQTGMVLFQTRTYLLSNLFSIYTLFLIPNIEKKQDNKKTKTIKSRYTLCFIGVCQNSPIDDNMGLVDATKVSLLMFLVHHYNTSVAS